MIYIIYKCKINSFFSVLQLLLKLMDSIVKNI